MEEWRRAVAEEPTCHGTFNILSEESSSFFQLLYAYMAFNSILLQAYSYLYVADVIQKRDLKYTWYVMYQSYNFPTEGNIKFGPVIYTMLL